MKNEPLQDFTFYDYTGVEISYIIKTYAIDLQTLTDKVKFKPTRGWTKGETYAGKQLNPDTKEVETIERQKLWTQFAFEKKEFVNSNRFEQHAELLLEKLDQIQDNIIELIDQPNKFEILIQIYLNFDKEQDFFGFSSGAATLKRLTAYCHRVEWRNM